MITSDPAELERRHLADLLEAMRRCAFFSLRLSSAIPLPLTGNLLESRCNDFDCSAALESDEIAPGIILDYNQFGQVVGIEMLYLSKRVNIAELKSIEIEPKELIHA